MHGARRYPNGCSDFRTTRAYARAAGRSDVDQHTKEWVTTEVKGTGERLAEGLHRDMERM